MAELLLPAGNTENFITAINSYADAVYLGLGKFNARAKTAGFDEKNIEEWINYAHLRGVKVYITFNTLLKDDEFEEFFRLAKAAVNAHADAFIVQDIGAAFFLKQNFPNIVLHASTQMGIHNLRGAEIAEELGFERVILARETKKSDMKEIHERTHLETECFVQGALCVSFSGNCYFSSSQFNKSGNRGECLQLCRLKYWAKNKRGNICEGYLLSPADLCLIEKLNELKDCGISSFKVEGRLRRKGYVAAAAQCYRLALKGARIASAALIERLKKAFFRGDYNTGLYFEGNAPCIVNKRFQNHRGIKIGKVLNVEPFKNIYRITVSCGFHKLATGDGLKGVETLGDFDREVSFGVGNFIEKKEGVYLIFTSAELKKGMDLYLTVDSKEENAPTEEKKIIAEISFYAIPDKPIVIKAEYKNNEVTLEGENALTAQTAPLSEEEILSSLTKTGGTPFEFKKKEIVTDNVFIKKSYLNFLRREIIKLLEKQIIENYNSQIKKGKSWSLSIKNKDLNDNSYAVYSSIENFILNYKKGAQIVYSPDVYDLEQIKKFYDCILKKGESFFYLELPVYATSQDCLIIEDILEKTGNDKIGVISQNLWGLSFIKKGFKTVCGPAHNITNEKTANVLLSLGAKDFVYSYEPQLIIEDETIKRRGAFYEGKIPLMNFANCPYKTVYGNKCSNCSFDKSLTYVMQNGKKLNFRRRKANNCSFEMYCDESVLKPTAKKKFTDFTK